MRPLTLQMSNGCLHTGALKFSRLHSGLAGLSFDCRPHDLYYNFKFFFYFAAVTSLQLILHDALS